MTRSRNLRRSAASGDREFTPACSLVEMIEGRWTLQILLCLKEREHRFADLRAALPGIAPNVLTKRIRALERVGLVERRYLPPPSARHVYGLAPVALGLKPALDALADWQAGDQVVASR